MHLLELLSAGMPLTSTVAQPGAQGAVVTGTHGIGVRTPSAAAVAEATVGLLGVLHMPKGGMFTIGAMSVMFAAGNPPASGRPAGITDRVEGAAPKEQDIIAVATTWTPMVCSTSRTG